MSIQYTVPGFEPTIFTTQVSSHNHYTRAPAATKKIIYDIGLLSVCPGYDVVLSLGADHRVTLNLCRWK